MISNHPKWLYCSMCLIQNGNWSSKLLAWLIPFFNIYQTLLCVTAFKLYYLLYIISMYNYYVLIHNLVYGVHIWFYLNCMLSFYYIFNFNMYFYIFIIYLFLTLFYTLTNTLYIWCIIINSKKCYVHNIYRVRLSKQEDFK